MKKLAAKTLSTLPFAHLLGLSATASAEEDDDKKQRPDESDEDYAKRMEEEDKKDKDEDDDKSKAEDDQDKDGKKSKKATKAEGDDDEEEAEDEDDSAKAARLNERARCAAIFASPAAGTRPDVAAHLAFNTGMSAKEAISLLTSVAAGGAQAKSGLLTRMAAVKTPNVGSSAAEPAAHSPQAVAAQILAAGAKARGEK